MVGVVGPCTPAPGQEFDREIAAELRAAPSPSWWSGPRNQSIPAGCGRGEAREAADRGILVPVRFERRDPADRRPCAAYDRPRRQPPSRREARKYRSCCARSAPWSTASVLPCLQTAEFSSQASTAAGTASGRVAICVLPFTNMSGDPEQDYFSDGITETSSRILSKVSLLAGDVALHPPSP